MTALALAIALMLAEAPAGYPASDPGIGVTRADYGAPLINFGDTGTGVYLREDGSIGVVCDGVDRFTISAETIEVRICCDGVDRGLVDLRAIVKLWTEQ